MEGIAQNALTGRKWTFENLLALFACAVLLFSVVLIVDRAPLNEKTDFSVTYIGSRMVYLGLGSKLYDLPEQEKLKNQLLPDAEPLIFEHPPFEALLLSPLGALPYKTAYLIWGLVNIAIWLFQPFLLRPYLRAPQDDLGYLLLWLLFLPLGAALFEGQSSLIVLLLYSITYIQLRRGHDLRAGAVFGLALFKFQFAIPFALILLLRRKWRFIKGFIGSASVLGVLSLVAVGWRGILTYVNLLAGIAAHPENATYGSVIGMATVGGFVNPVLGKTLGHAAASLMVAGVSIFLLLWTAWRWKKAGPVVDQRTFDLMFAAAVLVSLATSLHMFTYDLSPLLLPMLLVATHFPGHSRTLLRIILGTTLLMFWMPPLFLLSLASHTVYFWFPVLMSFLIGIFKLAETPPETIPSTLPDLSEATLLHVR
jgi:Glycosyltransferase family 87